MGITPYAAGQFTTFDLPAYAEKVVAGANTFALTYLSCSMLRIGAVKKNASAIWPEDIAS